MAQRYKKYLSYANKYLFILLFRWLRLFLLLMKQISSINTCPSLGTEAQSEEDEEE